MGAGGALKVMGEDPLMWGDQQAPPTGGKAEARRAVAPGGAGPPVVALSACVPWLPQEATLLVLRGSPLRCVTSS